MLHRILLVVATAAPPTAAPAPVEADVAAAVARAVEVLLERQERYARDAPVGRLPDAELGAWQEGERERLAKARGPTDERAEWPYEGVYRVRGAIPAGYRVGGTAIVCEALLLAPGWADDAPRRAAVERALAFVLDRLEHDPALAAGPKEGYDVRGWGHAYALRLLLTARDADAVPAGLRARVDDALPRLLTCLEANALDGGGWNYARGGASPFMTGSTLLALFHARARGLDVKDELVAGALDALERGRTETASYAYSGPAKGEVAMPGSAARASIAELCLHLADRTDPAGLLAAVHGFFDGWEDLLARKSRQGTHEPPYGIAPYYFYYGHRYAALAIEALPEAARPELRARLRELLWRTRDEDGSWNDRVFPRTSACSTAMAVLALLAADAPPPHRWGE